MDDRTPGIRLRPSLGRRLDATARRAFPGTCTMLLMLLAAAPFGLPEQAVLLPALALASVYFWSLYRPASMPPPLVFLVGLLFDLLGYMPIGLGVLLLLSVYGVTVQARRFLGRQGFVLVWCVFAAVAAVASVLSWALNSLLTLQLLPFAPAVFEAVVSAALYPALASLFAHAHSGIADPERA